MLYVIENSSTQKKNMAKKKGNIEFIVILYLFWYLNFDQKLILSKMDFKNDFALEG